MLFSAVILGLASAQNVPNLVPIGTQLDQIAQAQAAAAAQAAAQAAQRASALSMLTNFQNIPLGTCDAYQSGMNNLYSSTCGKNFCTAACYQSASIAAGTIDKLFTLCPPSPSLIAELLLRLKNFDAQAKLQCADYQATISIPAIAEKLGQIGAKLIPSAPTATPTATPVPIVTTTSATPVQIPTTAAAVTTTQATKSGATTMTGSLLGALAVFAELLF